LLPGQGFQPGARHPYGRITLQFKYLTSLIGNQRGQQRVFRLMRFFRYHVSSNISWAKLKVSGVSVQPSRRPKKRPV
jgi:hypothetical protein